MFKPDKLLAITFVAMIAFISAVSADEELFNVEPLSIKPEGFDAPLEFNVTLPKNYSKDADNPYFVLFDLHPRSHLYLSGLHDWLSHNGGWPWRETIIVTQANYNKEFAAVFNAFVDAPDNPQILDILELMLKQVDKTYHTNGFRIYSGFVSNGALGLHALLERPTLFNAYIIASPSLAQDFGNVTSKATQKLKQLDDKMRFLYLTIGEHGYEQRNIDGVKSFEQSLMSSAPIELDWQVHYDTEHYYMTRPVIAVLNGIEALFDDLHTNLAPDSEISKQGPDAIISHYKALSDKKYGFEVSAERSLRDLANAMLESEPDQALALYQKIITLYPDSAYALSSLAQAYETLDNLELAISYQTEAVKKSATMSNWHQNRLQKILEAMKASKDNK